VIRFKKMGKFVHNHIILNPLGKIGQLAADENGASGTIA
jgi:hypothetical protein